MLVRAWSPSDCRTRLHPNTLCDADAPGAVESDERIHRDVPGGHRVDVVFVRERGSQSAPDLTSLIEREGRCCPGTRGDPYELEYRRLLVGCRDFIQEFWLHS